MGEIRWRLAADDQGQSALFADEEVVRRRVGTGEFRGLEFFEVNAQRVINQVPAASRMPFRYTINPYRGCSHACSYCIHGDTPILLADGRTRPMADLRVGDRIYGTERVGRYRRYVPTEVLAHWATVKPAFRVVAADGTEIIASGDHRFLTERGWKYVTGREQGRERRPFLTLQNKLLGTGQLAPAPVHDGDYGRGYLCGMIRGDGHLGSYSYLRAGRGEGTVHRFRLALADVEALHRTADFLAQVGVGTTEFAFAAASGEHRAMQAVRTSRADDLAAIAALISWPDHPTTSWCKGFLAGIFDAEGGYSRGVLRISSTSAVIVRWITLCLDALRFPYAFDLTARDNGLTYVRVTGGLQQHLRFFLTVDPAITRKRTFDGYALKCAASLRVVAIEPVGHEVPLYDITTGTGDFVANGLISHNCFARPTHEYLGLGIGEDFDRKLVVKVNAVERVRAELRSPKWRGEHIAMGTNTDPYQRCEGKYHLTQGIVDALGQAANPFSILTKSTLILRDVDRLVEAARRTEVRANFSIGTLDEEVWKMSEPGTPHPKRRVAAVAKLNEAGIPCGVLVAPILPGLSDAPDQLKAVIDAVVEAGAVTISVIGLHLRPGVREHYLAWLEATRPDLVSLYRQRYRRGAYLPKSDQQDLSELVRKLVDQARGRFASPRRIRHVDGSGPIRQRLAEQGLGPAGSQPRGAEEAAGSQPPVAEPPAGEQLDLGLV